MHVIQIAKKQIETIILRIHINMHQQIYQFDVCFHSKIVKSQCVRLISTTPDWCHHLHTPYLIMAQSHSYSRSNSHMSRKRWSLPFSLNAFDTSLRWWNSLVKPFFLLFSLLVTFSLHLSCANETKRTLSPTDRKASAIAMPFICENNMQNTNEHLYFGTYLSHATHLMYHQKLVLKSQPNISQWQAARE